MELLSLFSVCKGFCLMTHMEIYGTMCIKKALLRKLKEKLPNRDAES